MKEDLTESGTVPSQQGSGTQRRHHRILASALLLVMGLFVFINTPGDIQMDAIRRVHSYLTHRVMQIRSVFRIGAGFDDPQAAIDRRINAFLNPR